MADEAERSVLAVDIGKTSTKAAFYDRRLGLVDRTSFPTMEPAATINRLLSIASRCDQSIDAIGLSVFGPLDLDVGSPTFGTITISSDPDWSVANPAKALRDGLHRPVYFSHDVTAGAQAEHQADGRGDFVYLSVGTGIGAVHLGAQRSLGGFRVPQVGHMLVPRQPSDAFGGSCRFHGDCLQGLASGKAIEGRWGTPAHLLPASHPAWDLEATYLALAVVNLVQHYATDRILIGSGVAMAPELIVKVSRHAHRLLNGFSVPLPRGNLVERARFAPHSSLVGAGLLALHGSGPHMPHALRRPD